MVTVDRFRGDVEALRGIAVAIVVLFHLKLAFIPSGFIGVDIFFVISGYLMAVAFDGPDHSIKEFYERRARRVIPAALVVMTIFFLSAPVFFLPFESAKLVEQILGMLFLVPNLIFWKIDDYFSALNFTPLLHYWSLGVELQYYLVFPLLVYFFKNKMKWFLAMFTISLLLCLVVTPWMSKTAFFMLPTRMWEFFLGYFAFYAGKSNFLQKNLARNSRNAVAITSSLLLIIYSLCSIPKDQFPGLYSVPVALLSFLVITIGVSSDLVENSSVFKLLRWFGKLSYSIYLIHYPIIFLFAYQPFSEWKTLTLSDLAMIVPITLILSILSYRYIETPFRNRKKISFGRFCSFIGIIYIGLFGAMFFYGKSDYLSAKYPAQEERIFRAMSDTGNFRCTKLQRLKEYSESSCYLERNSGNKTYYLVGDSHMDAIKEAFVDVASKEMASVRLNRSRCFLGESECSYEQIAEQVRKFAITDVVLHGWAYDKFNYENLQKLIDNSANLGIRVHFIGPIPTYSSSVPLALFRKVRGQSNILEPLSRELFLAKIPQKYSSFMAKNRSLDKVFFYSPEEYFCPEVCLLEGADGIYYYDEHHLTITGAKVLIPIFSEIIRRSQ